MSTPRTLGVYDRMVDDYIAATEGDEPYGLDRFLAMVAPGARLLDLGCGTGQHAHLMARAGHAVLGVDGSPQMVARARSQPGVEAQVALFDDIGTLGVFGGVWASFSLLHAAKADFPRHLSAVRNALEDGGVLGLSMKKGTGEGTDRLGRFYAYYSEVELHGLLEAAGFTPTETIHGRSAGLAGHTEGWMVVLARV